MVAISINDFMKSNHDEQYVPLRRSCGSRARRAFLFYCSGGDVRTGRDRRCRGRDPDFVRMAYFADPAKVRRCNERDVCCIRDGSFDFSLPAQQEDIANRDAPKHQVVSDHSDREA